MVDDDPNAAALLGAALRGEPCRIEAETSCGAARARLADELPRVLVLEVDLPDGSGWELVRELRARDDARALPIVVTTARARPGAPEARGLAVRWMTKPFHLRQARLLLTPLLRGGRAATAEAPVP